MSKPHPNFGKGNRSLFPSHGCGKGDADRTDNVEAFQRNFDDINFGQSTHGFVKTARGQKKTYKTQ